MKRIVIAWPGYTGYSGPCFRALAQVCSLKLFLEPSRYEQRFDGGDLEGLDWCRVESPEDIARTVAAIRTFAPELVIICGWSTPLCRTLGKEKLGGRKVLAFDMPWEWSPRKIVARWALWPHLRHFDGAFVPGRRCARYAKWLGFGGRIQMGSNPSGFERFQGVEKVARVGKFLFVGRFAQEKGLDVLLDAYAQYRREEENPWALDLVGCGDALPPVLPEGVRVLGFVRPEEMPRVMNEHACLVLPSRWEPWGVCVAEAMSAGLATVVSDACGIVYDVAPTEVVKAGDVRGFVAAMRRISALSCEDLHRLGVACRAAVARYSAANWVARVLSMVDGRFDSEVGE